MCSVDATDESGQPMPSRRCMSSTQLALETVELDRPMLLLTIDMTERFGLSAYDAMYLALAECTGWADF